MTQNVTELTAESAVVACAILDSKVLDDVGFLSPQYFHSDRHRAAFTELVKLYDAGNLDLVHLIRSLQGQKEFAGSSSSSYVAGLSGSPVVPENCLQYAIAVREDAKKRELRRNLADAQTLAESDSATSKQIIELINQQAADAETNDHDTGVCRLADALTESVDRIILRSAGKHEGRVLTGFDSLDELTAGMHPNELTILAARPGMGKTALALTIAENVARAGDGVLFVSLEMSRHELADRLISANAGVNGLRLRDGSVNANEEKAIAAAMEELQHLPISILDQTQATIAEIASLARRIQSSLGLSLIVIDYLQLIEPDDSERPRHEQVAKMARRLKQLARRLSVPVLCLSQLNRVSADGNDHRPRMSHLRESGAIEQDADVVMFVHREGYYSQNDKDASEASIIVEKQRNGPTGEVSVEWQASIGRFKNCEPERFREFDEYAGGFPQP